MAQPVVLSLLDVEVSRVDGEHGVGVRLTAGGVVVDLVLPPDDTARAVDAQAKCRALAAAFDSLTGRLTGR